ncbi:uncharacterized protein LOC129765886 [Toxorhynchites rutilus septentrionalis]|uniref:uncharacterized protein LOC129765886 n=1 Tax=Toxorhynchites rutilus septentrionalis TaxID=329112 RepID=UPI00247A6DDA|nr:uncharacterized protein LOC129765886 [Toxorhynchites rutilus septentrionalis]
MSALNSNHPPNIFRLLDRVVTLATPSVTPSTTEGYHRCDRIIYDELQPRKFGVVALQELCWTGQKVLKSGHRAATFYQSCGTTNELGTDFVVLGKMRQRVIGWLPTNARISRLRIKGRFFNYSIINVHCPHEGRPDDEKESFYAQLEQVYDSCPQRDVKIVIGDVNAQVGRENF